MRSFLSLLSLLFLVVLMHNSPSAQAADFPSVSDLPSSESLPDPLTLRDGTKVTTADVWFAKRRPELKELFAHYMYGFAPEDVKTEFKVTKEAEIFGGKGLLKEVEIRFPELSADAPKVHLAIFLPKTDKPVPVFLGLNKCGNHTVIEDAAVSVSSSWQHSGCGDDPESHRGEKKDFWCVDYLISRGYGFATYHESDIDPDKHDWTDGIHPHFPELFKQEKTRWGTISAWAWGLQRCIDYLETDKQIAANKICVIGHSRRGKTALLTAARDERVALVVPHQSGTGGMALSRENSQETVARINKNFPHWFNDTFTEFDDNEAKLPFDQHCLVALVAPRAVLDTAGEKDQWANPGRALENLKAASPVWELLGEKGVVGDGQITEDGTFTADNTGRISQYSRDEKHTLTKDYWRAILDFADLQLGKDVGRVK